MRIHLFIAILLLLVSNINAQKDVTTFGVQFKPIIPSKFFNSGPEMVMSGDSLEVNFVPRLGFNFGMVVRRGFTKMLSLETGINMVRRNYSVSMKDTDLNLDLDMKYAFVGYEVPILGLIYVQLGDKLWMNGAAGFSIDFYPSNVYKLVSNSQDTIIYDFDQHTYRKSWVSVGVLANYGFEYRTRDNGYFYVGASYHRPFGPIAITESTYMRNGKPATVQTEVSGIYLTLDVRYFFHEDAERRRVKTK